MLISRVLGYRIWDLPVWVPNGRLDDWLARQRDVWAVLEAALDPIGTAIGCLTRIGVYTEL